VTEGKHRGEDVLEIPLELLSPRHDYKLPIFFYPAPKPYLIYEDLFFSPKLDK